MYWSLPPLALYYKLLKLLGLLLEKLWILILGRPIESEPEGFENYS